MKKDMYFVIKDGIRKETIYLKECTVSISTNRNGFVGDEDNPISSIYANPVKFECDGKVERVSIRTSLVKSFINRIKNIFRRRLK